MGGELFQDELIDNNFLNYFSEFIETLESQKPSDKKISYNFITNLIFTKTDDILNFLKKYNLKIAISYDPVARFNKTQLLQFKKNIDIFKPFIRVVSSVMTKQNIQHIMNGDDYFDYLYNNFTIHFDHLLVGDEKFDYMMPTEKNVYDFYCFLLDNYPKCLNVLQFLEKNYKTTKMSCTRGNSYTIFADNSIPIGCSGSVVLKHNKTAENWSTKIIDNFLIENECLTCKYYSRCNLTCFVNNDYSKLVKDINGCTYKKVFEYAEIRKIKEQIQSKGFVELYEPQLCDIVNLENYTLLNTEERNRDNGKLDLPEDLNFKLSIAAQFLKEKYIDPNWENNKFYKYTVWDGVDKDNQGWHTDMFEDYDVFFLYYYDNTKEETGGAIQFKWKENDEFKISSYQPKKGSLFLVSNDRGFWHRAESTKITRRVMSFDFIINE
jgi:hypothetical protein